MKGTNTKKKSYNVGFQERYFRGHDGALSDIEKSDVTETQITMRSKVPGESFELLVDGASHGFISEKQSFTEVPVGEHRTQIWRVGHERKIIFDGSVNYSGEKKNMKVSKNLFRYKVSLKK